MLPSLVRLAKIIHRGEPGVLVETAILEAWRGLAGAAEWTPGMVRRVKAELGEARR